LKQQPHTRTLSPARPAARLRRNDKMKDQKITTSETTALDPPKPPPPPSPQPVATFDIDESTAALVLEHVGELRDRMRLACTSTVWRLAAAAPTCERLVVEGAVAARLTDDRMARLLSCCGNLRFLEVRDAPSGFTGVGFALGLLRNHSFLTTGSFSQTFPELQTFVVNQCPGVEAGFVYEFLDTLRVHRREKGSRLDRLSLAGCSHMDQDELDELDAFVRHDRDVNLPFSEGNFDLWPCVQCDQVIDEGLHCVVCKSVACLDHAGTGLGDSICSFCDAYLCLSADCGADEDDEDIAHGHGTHCNDCGVEICYPCAFGSNKAATCMGSDAEDGWILTPCRDCDPKCDKFTFCSGEECAGFWCDNCLPADTLRCTGTDDIDGCYTSFCPACNNGADEIYITTCDSCGASWCIACEDKNGGPLCGGGSDASPESVD
jgi:hypothetical protein